MKCYNCGIELTKEEKTREHIPAKNLYLGYPEEYKNNLIVVDACLDCNQKYSKIDQEIRDAIGFMNDDNMMQKELTEKSIKSIFRKKEFNKIGIENGKLYKSFNYNDFRELHLKNFKGIIYYNYKEPLLEEFILEVISEGDEEDGKLMMIKKLFQNYLNSKEWKISGHTDIFKYRYVMINLKKEGLNKDFSETDNIDDCDMIVGEFFYHNRFNPIIFATKKESLESIRNKY